MTDTTLIIDTGKWYYNMHNVPILGGILAILGLFIFLPYYEGKIKIGKICFGATIGIGHIPLGWIMILVAYLI